MNNNYYLVYDLETGSVNPKRTQPLQFCGAILHPRKLTIESTFQSYIKPYDDHELYDLDVVGDEALNINGIKREQLESAPSPKVFWEMFANWIKQYNIKGNKYSAPIRVGYNIKNFDNEIMRRLKEGHLSEHYMAFASVVKDETKDEPAKDKKRIRNYYNTFKEPYGFKGGDLYNNVYFIDVFDIVFPWLENKQDVSSYKLTALRDYFGMPYENAHNAYNDVIDTAEIFRRFLEAIRNSNPQLKGKFNERLFQYKD